jgi:hypothetical protein
MSYVDETVTTTIRSYQLYRERMSIDVSCCDIRLVTRREISKCQTCHVLSHSMEFVSKRKTTMRAENAHIVRWQRHDEHPSFYRNMHTVDKLKHSTYFFIHSIERIMINTVCSFLSIICSREKENSSLCICVQIAKEMKTHREG